MEIDEDTPMELGEFDKENRDPFPPIPTLEDEEFLEDLLKEAEVPNLDIVMQAPVLEVEDETAEYTYAHLLPTAEFKDTFLVFEDDSMQCETVQPDPQEEIEKVLFETMESLKPDPKTKAPISPEDLLTMFTFRTANNDGIAVPTDNTSGYEFRSIVSDLLLLRIPSCHTIFGGVKIIDHEVMIANEIMNLNKGTRRKEKERDSGQGKAPTKQQKLAKKLAMLKAKEEREAMEAREAELAAAKMETENEQNQGMDLPPATPQARESTPKPEKKSKSVPGTPKPKTVRIVEPPQKKSPLKLSVKPPIMVAEPPTSAKSPNEIIHCICLNPTMDDGLFMICCDLCHVWFHGACVNVFNPLDNWSCSRCKK